jgi:hypothetical protein
MYEMGLAGEVQVVHIGPCHQDSREGKPGYSIVIGKIEHENAIVWDLVFNHDTAHPLGVTANHPLFSEDREDWVPAGELKIGEKVRTLDGTATLTGKKQRPGRHKVYNLEVHRTHTYFVGREGLWVHNCNNYIPPSRQLPPPRPAAVPSTGSLGSGRGGTSFINGVKIYDRNGNLIAEGTVDLQPTLDRIQQGVRFPHRNDGSIFGNRQGLLPARPHGYYTDFLTISAAIGMLWTNALTIYPGARQAAMRSFSRLRRGSGTAVKKCLRCSWKWLHGPVNRGRKMECRSS